MALLNSMNQSIIPGNIKTRVLRRAMRAPRTRLLMSEKVTWKTVLKLISGLG